MQFQFDFARGYQEWQPGFADYGSGSLDNYFLQHAYRPRPTSVGAGGSLFISGMNRSDDLFMFHKRKVCGLPARTAVKADFTVKVASKYVRGHVGSGGDPALSVFLKACLADAEPEIIYSEQAFRLNIDIGRQTYAGANSVLLGDIEKPKDGTQNYVLIERKSSKSLVCTTDEQGCLWVLFGTDSGYEGETALYYTNFEMSVAAD